MAKKVKKTTKKATVKKVVKKKTAKKAVIKKAAKKKAAPKATKKVKTTKAKKASVAKKTSVKKAVKKKTAVKAKAKSSKKNAVKKIQTKKVRKVSRKRKSTLGKKQLHHFYDLLVEKLKEIVGDVNQIETEALKTSRLDASGDLSSMPIHMADIGSDNYEQEFALGLMDSERKIVNDIHAALRRISEGTYGICEGTGEEIPLPRLEGIPWTPYCIRYAEMLEKGLVKEGDRLYDDEEDQSDADASEDNVSDDDDDVKGFYSGFDDDERI